MSQEMQDANWHAMATAVVSVLALLLAAGAGLIMTGNLIPGIGLIAASTIALVGLVAMRMLAKRAQHALPANRAYGSVATSLCSGMGGSGDPYS